MNYISDFRKRHLIDKKANLSSIQTSLEGAAEANKIAYGYISEIEAKDDSEHFQLLSYTNLIGRIYEQVEGMLATIAINCPTSSEALGRVVIEGSINLTYMAMFGNEKTLLAFLSSWVTEHQRKLNEWSENIKSKEYSERVQPMIAERMAVVDIYNEFVQQGINKFGADVGEFRNIWPKSIYKRFEAVGKEDAYYENYHRLSGASHITAEDTISWLLSLNFDDQQRINLAKEAWAYSIMMARLSSLFFIDAVAASCIHFGMRSGTELERMRELKENIIRSVQDIAKSAGVPMI
ncbi:DUF5677 domain-containing protein [Aeromonas caviae]|uniref:DUF5677 domain-containing protein n=1 Tax=Aeromonas caviae TaxID=648 RepID=UPI002B47D5C3|nr:DUF5677 domain-containing protein [Aeromonas caviae]